MEIKDSYELPLPKERVWAALNDEQFLKKSIPWCEKLERRSETELAAEVKENRDVIEYVKRILADEAAKSSMCIPIGEGENCW